MNKIVFRFLNKLSFLEKKLNFNLILNDKKFKVPIVRGIGIENFYMSETWMVELLEKLLAIKQLGAFIDVGVNVGQTLLKLKSVTNRHQYIGFEPNPYCLSYLYELIELNNFRDDIIIPYGLSNEDNNIFLNFYYKNIVDSTSSIVPNFRPDQSIERKIYVQVRPMNEIKLIKDLDEIAIIKIDVEGAEMEVIEGAKKTIESKRPVLIIEILPVYKEANLFRLDRQRNIEKIMKELNYKLFRIKKTSNNRLEGLSEIKEIEIHSNLDQCDYVFVPKELENQL
jgi:FkbM family methyltransferase